jgi:tryptophan synthase alpha chain
VTRFAATFASGKKALVTYLCVGDPDAPTSIDVAVACAEAGADILELGCPFSDPSADGPAIARASQRALARGGGLAETLRVARAVRERTNVPIVLFGYYNPLFVRGEERAVAAAADAGIDALLVVDLPVDESASLRRFAGARGLGVVPLVAPTSTKERIATIAEVAKGGGVPFVYYVSMTGVTGGAGAKDVLSEAAERAAGVRAATGIPTVVGFGIDSPDRVRHAGTRSDGVVVGSALVRLIEEGRSAAIADLVRDLKAALPS